MQIKCPHCGEDIQLIGSVAIKHEFKLGPNAVETRRKNGDFPEPVLDLGNRLLWIRQHVVDAIAKERRREIVNVVQQLEQTLSMLSPEEQEEARRALAREIDNNH